MDLITILGVIGPGQIVLVVVILLLLFGGRKIPELMRGIGEGVREFKKAANLEDTKKTPVNNASEKDKKTDEKK
jgi:sec-independent protein translocase protein TatA